MRRVFYLSRAVKPMANAEIQAILHISRRNNRRSDVTGCLMYSAGFFAQMLEGRKEAVGPLVARIAVDPRHAHLQIIIDEYAAQRLCPDWSMGLIYDPYVADRLGEFASGLAEVSVDEVHELMMRMGPDSLMGPLT